MTHTHTHRQRYLRIHPQPPTNVSASEYSQVLCSVTKVPGLSDFIAVANVSSG